LGDFSLDFLPYSDADGVWRAIGIRGQSDFNAYRLNVVDPNIEEWLNSSSDDYLAIAGSQDHFGDIGLGIFIRPVCKDTFKFLAGARLYLADIPAANVMRVINGILTTTWAYAAGGANFPTNIITDAEVLANGTLKLGFNLQRKFFSMPPELLVEIQAFKKQLWNALYHDFQRIKAKRGYQ
jgi:hypothetical protein